MSQRAPSRAMLAPLTGLILAVASVAGPSNVRAAARASVSVGEVSVSVDPAAVGDGIPELGRALRTALNDELLRVKDLGPMKRPVVVSATLTRLSSEHRDERAQASATISLALRRADDQVLFAELRGRATVEDASGNLASLRRAAVQGAVRGALTRLPEAVQRAR